MVVTITGPSGSGKTSLCRAVLALAHAHGLDCAGVISLARFQQGLKVGIDLLAVRQGRVRPLAEADNEPGLVRTSAYRFHPHVLAWGSTVLRTSTPCDVLFIDELGPLELVRGEGWVEALDVLRSGRFRLGVVVVRPALLEAFQDAVSTTDFQFVRLPTARPDDVAVRILAPLLA